jgi:hypothetical protein
MPGLAVPRFSQRPSTWSMLTRVCLLELDDLVEPTARGNPMSPLRWTAKSVRTLAGELTAMGHPVSASKVGQLLHLLGYSLQAPVKEVEGA